MRYLTLGEVADLHGRLLQATGGASGIRDLGALESAIAQPKATFGGVDLYPTLPEKRQPWGSRWFRATRLWTATSAWRTRLWKPSSFSMAPRLMLP